MYDILGSTRDIAHHSSLLVLLDHEDEGNMIFRNVEIYLSGHKA